MDCTDLKVVYDFVGQGTNLRMLEYVEDETLIIDVGNALKFGVFDHHFKVNESNLSLKSTSLYVINCPHFIPSRINRIITHLFPDLDCWLSIYLSLYYSNYKNFPKGYEFVVDFVTKYDNGVLNYELGEENKIWAVVNLIQYKYTEQIELLERGLCFIDLLFKSIDKINSQNIQWYMIDLRELQKEFSELFDEIEEDFKLFLHEIEEPSNVEIKWVRVINQRENKIEKVQGMFWKKIPKCKLHKHWARNLNKEEQPIILTSIPQEIILENDRTHKMSRIIISINPNYDYSLFGLGRYLEQKEQHFEKLRTGSSRSENGKDKRYKETWCDSDDPWYDGRGHNYSIIDAPRRGSVLSYSEIEDCVMNFLEFKIQESKTKYILALNIHHKNLSVDYESLQVPGNMFEYCDLKSIWGEINSNKLFLESVTEFFIKLDNCNIMEIKDGLINIDLNILFNNTWSRYYSGNGSINVISSKLIFVDNRQAYFIVETNEIIDSILPDLTIDRFKEYVDSVLIGLEKLMMSSALCHKIQVKSILNKYTQHQILTPDTIKYENYCDKFFQEFLNHSHSKMGKGGSVIEKIMVEGSTLYKGAGKNSLVQIQQYGQSNEIDERLLSDQYIHFYSLFQRDCLLKFSYDLLGVLKKRSGLKHLNQLNYDFILFMTQYWSDEISNIHDICIEYYKWINILNVETLYHEVQDQINTFSEYVYSARSKRINFLSALFLPISASISIYNSKVYDHLVRYMSEKSLLIGMCIIIMLVSPAIYKFLNRSPKI